MKTSLLAALAIAVTGQVLYHVAQKTVSSEANPVLSILVFYAVAALLTLPLFALYPVSSNLGAEFAKLNWAVFAVAASIVLIELGFLLAYRAGGELSSTFIVTAAVVTTAMLLLGYFFFNETLSVTKLVGVVLCIVGIALISQQSAHL